MSRRDEDVATEMFVIGSHDYVMFFYQSGPCLPAQVL